MKLFLVTNKVPDNFNWDWYDSFVICCNNMDEAWQTHPTGKLLANCRGNDEWPIEIENVDVKYLGEADQDLPAGIVCASFHAG